jgi:2-polyprenyl-3-methyl-5-hydroxy-6-metoxy-1,4-benzoquinol methylase
MPDYRGIEIRAAEGLHEVCMELMAQHVSKGSKVLDLAGSAGAFSARLADAGYNVTGNDIDDEHWAAPQVPKLTVDLNEPFESALEAGSYPAVVAMEVIEHLNNPVKLLEDCRRLVAPGGCILISTPNVLDIESRLTYLRSGFPFHFSPQSFFATGHRTILPYWLLELLFEEAGLVIEKPAVGRNPDARWRPDRIARTDESRASRRNAAVGEGRARGTAGRQPRRVPTPGARVRASQGVKRQVSH